MTSGINLLHSWITSSNQTLFPRVVFGSQYLFDCSVNKLPDIPTYTYMSVCMYECIYVRVIFPLKLFYEKYMLLMSICLSSAITISYVFRTILYLLNSLMLFTFIQRFDRFILLPFSGIWKTDQRITLFLWLLGTFLMWRNKSVVWYYNSRVLFNKKQQHIVRKWVLCERGVS